MRHGIAEDNSPTGKDADRALTKEGIERVHLIGQALQSIRLDAIVSSPFKRAHQTAEIVAEETGFKKPLAFDSRIVPSGSFYEFSELVREMGESAASSVLFVGHEPSMSSFASGLCADHTLRMDFKKGAVCCVELANVRSMRGVLQWYAPPRLLIGKGGK